MQNITQETINVMIHKRAAIYVRVSTDRQEENGTSLDTQVEKCMEYCKIHHYRINQQHIYRDVWTGTEYMERPALTKLREDARNGLVDIVVIYAFDRLARKQVHQAVIIEDLRRSEVNIESVTENFDESAVGQFLRNAAAFAAELEHEKIRERTQRGRLQKLRNGQLLGAGIATYGYDWNEDRTAYIINAEEAKVVKRVFNMYAYEGHTLRSIMYYLRENIPNKRGWGLWQGSAVHRMLSNPLYIGECSAYKWHEVREGGKRKRMVTRPPEERIKLPDGVVPAIIDKETFEIVQAKLAVNKQLASRNNKDPERSLLRCGFVKCGNCGHNLLAQRKPPTGRSINDAYVYACHDGDMPTRCNKVSIRTHILDAEVWRYVEGLIKDQTKVEKRLAELEAKLTQDITVDLDPIDSQLAEVERQLQNCATGIARAENEFIINGLLAKSEELGKTQKELLDLRDKVSSEITDKEKVRAKLDHFRNRWLRKLPALQGEPTFRDKREAIEILGVHATVWGKDHNPRYDFKMIPPEIESLSS